MRTLSKGSYLTTLFSALFLSATSVVGGPYGSEVPSYQKALSNYQALQADAANAPKVSVGDKQVMKNAINDLSKLMPNVGLGVGDKAPDFTLPNAYGKTVRLYDQLKKGPVVLSFYRGAWCPYCNLQLRGLKQSLPHFEQHGGQLIAVTPQIPDKSLEQVTKDGYPFEILSDLDNTVMKNYRLYFEVTPELSDVYIRNFSLDLADYNGPGRYGLPVPGTFVIDRNGSIRAAFANVDYKQRMEPQDILVALRAIEQH